MAMEQLVEIPVRTLGAELRRRFGCRVQKVPVHAGLTCPNRDGTRGRGGCLYCDPHGSAAPGARPDLPVGEQLERGMEAARRRFGAGRFIAYFQAFTNTYADPGLLERFWDETAVFPKVVGLAVGTRPDCLPDPVLDLLAGYAGRFPYLCLEIGLPSAHDATLARIGRGHDAAAFAEAVERVHGRGIAVCAHVILGLPGEGPEEMEATVRFLLDLRVEGIKFHHLHVLSGSPLEAVYRQGRIRLLERDEYLELLLRLLARIRGRMVVHRFMGEAPPDRLVAPVWTRDKAAFLRELALRLREEG